jgi:hypothetical protein
MELQAVRCGSMMSPMMPRVAVMGETDTTMNGVAVMFWRGSHATRTEFRRG